MADTGISPEDAAEGAPPPFGRLLDKLSTDYRFDFREYKVASLVRRIRTRMAQVHVDDVDRYIAFLDEHPEEPTALFNTLLINVTGFFRDPAAWEVLDEHALPRLLDRAAASGLRVWSAGCASGEEAYTVAILLAERLGEAARGSDVKIYGTDLDEEVLTVARHGLYRLEQLQDLPAGLLERHFTRDGQLYRIRRDLRRWCVFGRHNLVQDPPLSQIDLIVCRNVLIYFKSRLQERLIPRFHYSLRSDGILFLGKSESLLARSRWFAPVSVKWRIFERAAPAPRPAPATLRAEVEPTAVDPARHGLERSPPAPSLERVLEALPVAMLVVEPDDTIRAWNQAAAALFEIPADSAVGRKFRELDISYRVEGLRARIEQAKGAHGTNRLDDVVFSRRSGLMVHADIRIAPLLDERQRLVGLLVTVNDVSEQTRLRDVIAGLTEQHATATEELQSTNEELETTNEELQSTNEELETTNEELQSTNEELLATIDELQAVNNEQQRLAVYHASVVQSVDQPLMVLDRGFRVTSWNPAAERLWNLGSEHTVGREFFALPIGDVTAAARDAMRRIQEGASAASVTDVPFTVAGREGPHVLRLLPLDINSQLSGILGLVLSRPRSGPR
jgi:two-component system CheB/CheR fusion protein